MTEVGLGMVTGATGIRPAATFLLVPKLYLGTAGKLVLAGLGSQRGRW